MNQLYSIPVALSEIKPGLVDAAWVIPPEAEEQMQAHCGDPAITLDKLFQCRLANDSFPAGWSWMLVVLPGRYPIGGHLAWARGGRKTNLILQDRSVMSGWHQEKKRHASTWSFPLPAVNNLTDVHVSFMWIASKGLLAEMGKGAGGWLASLSDALSRVPENQHWVYFAAAPPEEWVQEVAADNRRLYREWADMHSGPDWRIKDNSSDQLVCELAFQCSVYSFGESRARFLMKYLSYRPHCARAWATLADVYLTMGRDRPAVACARIASRHAPEWIFPRHLEMRCLNAMGWNKKAGRIAMEILDKAPFDACALTIAAYAASSEGNLREAILLMQRACYLDPFNRNSRNNLGKWYSMVGDNDCAIRIFEELLRQYPEHHLYMNNAGYLFALRGELAKALVLCERACELERTTNNLDSLGFVYLRMGKVVEAIALFREALELWPDHQEAIDHLAEAEALRKAEENHEGEDAPQEKSNEIPASETAKSVQ